MVQGGVVKVGCGEDGVCHTPKTQWQTHTPDPEADTPQPRGRHLPDPEADTPQTQRQTPPPPHLVEESTEADSTHHDGMHSCFNMNSNHLGFHLLFPIYFHYKLCKNSNVINFVYYRKTRLTVCVKSLYILIKISATTNTRTPAI